jgi:hypothetical protein
MQGRSRLLFILAGAAAVIVLFVLFRPSGDEEDESDAAPTTTAAEATEATTTEASTTTAPETTITTATTAAEPSATVLRITVRGGRPVGGIQRTRANKGESVRVVVRSDVSDEVHLHGYDVMRDVGPGQPAQIAIRATLTGKFEIELEDRGLPIGELEVRP